MSKVIHEIKKVSELNKYINQKGFVEIMLRRKDAKFSEIVRVLPEALIDNKDNTKEITAKLLELGKDVNKNIKDVRKEMNNVKTGIGDLTNIAKDMAMQVEDLFDMTECVQALSYLNTGLALANIAVDVTGFAMLSMKLDTLGKEVHNIDVKLDKLADANKHEKIADFQKLIMQFNSISTKIRDKEGVEPDSIENLLIKMRAFVSEMLRDLSDEVFEKEVILEIINTLMPAYTILFCEYLDRYYFEKQKEPANYDMFISLYDELVESNFVQKLEDYYFLDMKMHNIDVIDIINAQMLLGLNGRVQVEDQLEILKTLKTEENVKEFERDLDNYVREEIGEKISEISGLLNVSEDKCRETLQLGA